MSNKFLSAVTFDEGLAQSVTFSFISTDDLPAIAFSSLSDVSVSGVVNASILYYKASDSKWHALSPYGFGSAVLTITGIGQLPSWQPNTLPSDLVYTDVANTFTITPQTFQTGGDTNKGIVVQGNSATQSAALQDFQTSTGQTGLQVLFPHSLDDGGVTTNHGPRLLFTRSDNGASGSLYFSANGNRFVFTKDVRFEGTLSFASSPPVLSGAGFTIKSSTGTAVTVQAAVNNSNHASASVIVDTNGNTATTSPLLSVRNNTVERFYIDSTGAAVVIGRDAATNTATVLAQVGHNTTGTAAAGFGTDFRFQLETSTTEDIDAASVIVTWATATHASRKARVVHNVYDTAVREAFRVEASGSAAMIGFLGTAAVVQQTGDIGDALVAYGLLTSPSLKVGNGGTGNAKGSPVGLFDHYASQGNGTTLETDLYNDSIAAGQLANNGEKLAVEYGGLFVSSATATRQIKLYFGVVNIFDTGALTLSLSSAWTMYASFVRVSASVVRYMISFTTEGAALAAYTAVGELTGLTLSGAYNLRITAQAAGVGAATNDIVAMLGSVSWVPAAA